MRRMIILTVTLLASAAVFGQKTPLEYLNAIPAPPANPCEYGIGEKTQFLEELENILSPFRLSAEKESEASENFQEEHQDEQTVSALMKMGYTRQEAEKLKNADQMSEAEQMAIANQMMMRKNNISIKEAKKVSEYDSASLSRWGKAQSTMVMADQQINQEENTKKQIETKGHLELQDQIKSLSDELTAGENRYLEMLRQLDAEADTARSEMNPEIDKLYKSLSEGNGNSQQIINRIQTLRHNYCGKFTPKYLQIIEGYKGYIADNLEEYYRLEELQLKLAESQGILDDPNYTPGKIAMAKAGSYSSMVSDVFKYNLNSDPGAQFIGY